MCERQDVEMWSDLGIPEWYPGVEDLFVFNHVNQVDAPSADVYRY
jgi:hypothetical protein